MRAPPVPWTYRTRLRDSLLHVAIVLLAAVALSWPIFANRQPFFLSDTTSYVRGGDAVLYKLTGKPSDWSDRYIAKYDGSKAVARKADGAGAQSSEAPVTLAGRSIYYGMFLDLSDRLAGFRLAAAVQALLAAACLYLTLARFRSRQPTGEFFLLVGLLSLATSLPYFISYLMPDIFTGLGLLAAAHLITRTPPLSRSGKTFWFVLLCLSALFHTANILILLVVLAVACGIRHEKKLASKSGIWLLASSLVVGLSGEIGFYTAVDHFAGAPPVRPPFLTARLIADGPGRDYLEQTCPGSGFALCRHLSALSGSSDDFLWSDDPRNGVFSIVPDKERRQIAAEQNRFVLNVVGHRSLQVLSSFALDIWAQSRMSQLPEFNLTPKQNQELAAKLPPRILRQQSETRAFAGTMPVRLASVLTFPAALLSLCILLWAFARGLTNGGAKVFVAVLLVGVAADVTICGAISTPHDRYIMRVIWLVPVAAFAIRSLIRSSRRPLPSWPFDHGSGKRAAFPSAGSLRRHAESFRGLMSLHSSTPRRR